MAKSDLFTERQVELARIARSLGHPARIAIVGHLLANEKMTCKSIVDTMPLAQATVSQHLKALKEAGLVRGESCGSQVCYSLVTDQVADFCREFRKSLGQSK